jgi:hypothetical protein
LRQLCAETQTFHPETREPLAIVREILTLILSSLSKSTSAVSALEHSVQLSHRHTPSSWQYVRFSVARMFERKWIVANGVAVVRESLDADEAATPQQP